MALAVDIVDFRHRVGWLFAQVVVHRIEDKKKVIQIAQILSLYFLQKETRQERTKPIQRPAI